MSIVVNDVSPRVHHVATQGQTVFTVPFAWTADTHLKVYVNEVLCVFDAPPLDSMHYSTTGVGTSAGGSITFGAPGRTVNDHVIIFRDMPIARTSDLPTSGVFPVATLNDTFDNQAAMIQQTEINVQERTLGMAVNDFVHPLNRIPNRAGRAGKVLGFDNDGQPTMYPAGGGGGGVGDGVGNTNQHWTGDGPPPQPWQDGDLWWESDTGALHMFYVDVDSGQWVEVSAGSGGTPDVSHLINPKWYDVTGDGVADDTAEFQTMLDAADGRVVWIDGLNIKITSTITVPQGGMHLAGNGIITYTGTGNLFQGCQIDLLTYSFVAVASQVSFAHSDPYTSSFIEVYVNGVFKDPRTYRAAHNVSTLTIIFNTAATAGQTVDVKCYRINPTVGTLPAFSRVIVGTGVQILTTQRNQGRAFALGWYDSGFVVGRQFPSFLMEAGAVIRGVNGNCGFRNAIWLSGWQASQINGYIFGVGANQIPNIPTDNTICDIGIFLTGKMTSSDLRCTGAEFGYYNRMVATYWDTVEGISFSNMTFLNVGHAVWAEGRSTDIGMQIGMIHCHANCYHGTVYADIFTELFVGDCNLFQNPDSTEQFFQFIELYGGSVGAIHDNDMRSFVTGANVTGVRVGRGTRGVRVHNNHFVAADTTSTYIGFVAEDTSLECVVGPNSYYNGARAVLLLAGANRIGVVEAGDLFFPLPTEARYHLTLSTNWWITQKWALLTVGSVSIASGVLHTLNWSEARDPDQVFSTAGTAVTVPVWATGVRIFCRITWNQNATGTRMMRVMLNGAETGAKHAMAAVDNPSGNVQQHGVAEFPVTPGDQLTVVVFQNSGAALSLVNGEFRLLFL